MMDTNTRRIEIIDLLILSVPLVVGTFLRFYDLNNRGMWMDEAVIADCVATARLEADFPRTPFVVALMLPFRSLMTEEFTSRIVPAFAGSLSIAMMYFLARLGLNRLAGFIAAILFALWPLHVDFSRQMEVYVFAETFAIAAGIAIFKLVECGSTRRTVLAALLTVCTIYAHPMFGVPLAVFTSVALLYQGVIERRYRDVLRYVYMGVAVALCTIPYFTHAYFHRPPVSGLLTSSYFSDYFSNTDTSWSLPIRLFTNLWFENYPSAEVSPLFLVLAGLSSIAAIVFARPRMGVFMFVIAGYGGIAAVLGIMYLFNYGPWGRYFMGAMPFVLVTVSIGIAAMLEPAPFPRAKWAGRAGASAIASYLLVAAGSHCYNYYWELPGHDIGRTMDWLTRVTRKDDLVLISTQSADVVHKRVAHAIPCKVLLYHAPSALPEAFTDAAAETINRGGVIWDIVLSNSRGANLLRWAGEQGLTSIVLQPLDKIQHIRVIGKETDDRGLTALAVSAITSAMHANENCAPDAYLRLAELYASNPDLPSAVPPEWCKNEAIALLEKRWVVAGRRWELYQRLGDTYLATNRWNDALRALDLAVTSTSKTWSKSHSYAGVHRAFAQLDERYRTFDPLGRRRDVRARVVRIGSELSLRTDRPIIDNGSFESKDGTGRPSGWSVSPLTMIVPDAEGEALDGSECLKFRGTDRPGIVTTLFYTTPQEALRGVTLSLWVNTANNVGLSVGIEYVEDGTQESISVPIPATDEWMEFRMSTNLPPFAKETRIVIRVNSSPDAEFLVDNVDLRIGLKEEAQAQ